jgi:hypothetical protein
VVASFEYGGFNIKSVFVKGRMNNTALANACETVGMKPVCDSGPGFFAGNGGCQPFTPTISGGWSWSDPDQDIMKAIDLDQLSGVFFYNGNEALARKELPMRFNSFSRGVTTAVGEPSSDGRTLCAAPNAATIGLQQFDVDGHEIRKVPLNGSHATSSDLVNACTNGTLPVCMDLASSDGMCVALGDWSWSVATDRKQHKVCDKCVQQVSLYAANQMEQQSNFIEGEENKWSKVGLETLCTQDRAPVTHLLELPTTAAVNGAVKRTLVPARIEGRMIGANAIKACSKLGPDYKPVCDSMDFYDGLELCWPVVAQRGIRHMFSSPTNPRTIPNVWFFAGPHMEHMQMNNGLQQLKSGDGWLADRYTYCVAKAL